MSELQMQAKRAREAWRILAVAGSEAKNAALHKMADSLMDEISAFVEDNTEAEILDERWEIR